MRVVSSFLLTPLSRRGQTRCCATSVTVPWPTTLPPLTDRCWVGIGCAVVRSACELDTGPEAFAEVLQARRQLEIILQSFGYDLSVYAFGGVAVMGLLEAGGDVDFSAVADVEPQFDEASEIVARLGREMRRMGLKCTAIPRARVPVIKVDCAANTAPGTPMHSNSTDGFFRFARDLSVEERRLFSTVVRDEYLAQSCEWDDRHQCATVRFRDTSSLIVGLTHLRSVGSIEIPVRVPVEPRSGPELYRFPFDFCLSSSGLRNSHLLGEYLMHYPYARHLALVLKRWGRSAGIVNSIDGYLASYALTIMLAHFLVEIGYLPCVDTLSVTAEPRQLPRECTYRPLAPLPPSLEIIGKRPGRSARLGVATAGGSKEAEATVEDTAGTVKCSTTTNEEREIAAVGYIFAAFFEYYGRIFDYKKSVVCTTKQHVTKTEVPEWTGEMRLAEAMSSGSERPPFFHLCIKDPFSRENIARNLSATATAGVQRAHAVGLLQLTKDLHDPFFIVNSLMTLQPPAVTAAPGMAAEGGVSEAVAVEPLTSQQETQEAFRLLNKVEFHRRRDSLQRFGQSALRGRSEAKAARSVIHQMVGWLANDPVEDGAAGGDASPKRTVSSTTKDGTT